MTGGWLPSLCVAQLFSPTHVRPLALLIVSSFIYFWELQNGKAKRVKTVTQAASLYGFGHIFREICSPELPFKLLISKRLSINQESGYFADDPRKAHIAASGSAFETLLYAVHRPFAKP